MCIRDSQKDDVKSALRTVDEEKELRAGLGAALGGPEGRPTTDVDGPAVTEPVTEPTSPKVGATMDGSAHSFQGTGARSRPTAATRRSAGRCSAALFVPARAASAPPAATPVNILCTTHCPLTARTLCAGNAER